MTTYPELEFLTFIISAITGDPDCFSIERRIDEKGVLIEVTITQEHAGRLLGKKGDTAQALRRLLHALGHRYNARYNLRIVVPDIAEPIQ